MPAFALSIAIFLYWSVLGFSLVSALNSRRNLLRNALLSPAVGAAANVLVVIWVNLAGISLRRASLILTLVLFTGAVVWAIRQRALLPVKRLAPFAAVVVAGALLTGYPMLKFGFDWVSFGNDDMANYTLGGTFFSDNSYLSPPAADRIVHNRDMSVFIWYYLVGGGERPGVEFTLAWASCAAHVSSHQAYMPIMVALHLVLICAVAALLLQGRRFRTMALTVCLWAACSSLITLGTVYQLIAQVFGLGLLVAACTVICAPHRPASRRLGLGRLALSSLLCAGLLAVYPELLPFFLLTVFFYHAALLLRKRESWKAVVRYPAYVAVISILLVSVPVIGILTDVYSRMHRGLITTGVADILFPFYLIPSGLAHLWGFYPIGRDLHGSFLAVGIVVGGILLLAVCAAAVWHAWRGQAVAIMCLIMLAMGGRFFTAGSDFALYKLAMYIQPFLLGTAVLGWFYVVERGRTKWYPARLRRAVLFGPLALFIGYGLTAQVYYTQRSLGGVGGGFVEVPRASDSRLISQLIEISHRERSRAIVSDTYNVVLAKFQANYTMSVPLFFTSQDFIGHFLEKGLRPGLWQAVLNGIIPNLNATLRAIYEERSKRYREVQFDTHGALTSANHFTTATGADDSELLHATLLLTPGQSVLNRRHTPEAERSVFRTLDWAEARDQLFYVASDFGRNYYTDSGTRSSGRIAMFQLERDYFYKHATMVSMGRDTLLRVINPSPEFRLALEYTASLNADHENRIPPVSVVGAQRQFLAVAGRGSARLFSPVVQTQDIGGGRYLMLDMGTAGFRFPNRRKGLMTLWGRDIPLDARVIAGFGRDVSALSEREYEALAAPGQVQKFPADLANKSLEYSGVYEDGWVAESSYFTLGQSTAGLPLVVRVLVPLIGSQAAASRIIVLVDGAEVARRNLGPGDADLKIPGPGIGKHRIDLTFDRATRLPGIDGRPVSALIRFVGFRGD